MLIRYSLPRLGRGLCAGRGNLTAGRWLLLLLCLLAGWPGAAAWAQAPAVAPFQDDLVAARRPATSDPGVPLRFRALTLNAAALQGVLGAAPPENARPAARPVLVLPLPDGTSARFAIAQTPVLSSALAARYPSIRTYSGVGLDDPTARLRCDISPQGFRAYVLSDRMSLVSIAPVSRPATTAYRAYFGRDEVNPAGGNRCETAALRQAARAAATASRQSIGTQLREVKLAVSTTAEFTIEYGGAAGTLAAITTILNYTNAVFEKDLAVRLVLVGTMLYTDPATDPFSDPVQNSTLLTENRTSLTSAALGGTSFDLGHVLGVNNTGGLANVGVVCNTTYKSGGSSGFQYGITAYNLATFVHELGHQFGAEHTFNSAETDCLASRSPRAAWEPGSGTTFMSYVEHCGPDGIGFVRDERFNSGSIDQMNNHLASASCVALLATGDNLPVLTTPVGGKVLPAGTPFRLTAAATDADGDALTYSWEQMDLGPAAFMTDPQVPGAAVPLFRVRAPSASGTRYFPQLSDILANVSTTNGDRLPTVTRPLTLRCIVRAPHSGSQGLVSGVQVSDAVSLSVTSAAGPFLVTAPNTAVAWAGNSSQTVTWNVAGTDANGVNCATVNIRLSLDGGLTFPVLLAAATPNDGSQPVQVPNVASAVSTARIAVEAADNYFLDISNANFTISPAPGPVVSSLSPTSGVAGSTSVVISGTGFGTVAADVSVTIGGIAAPVTAISNTGLTVSVPTNALTGEVRVTKTGFAAISAGVFGVLPVLSGISPGSAGTGDVITLSGASLDGALSVTFADGSVVLPGAFTLNTATTPHTLTLAVPAGAVSGSVTVATAGGTASIQLTVLPFALVSRSPARHARQAAPTGAVALTFSQNPGASTAAGGGLYVHSTQRGGLRNGLGSFSSSGPTVSYEPTTPFLPGEVVSVTATTAAANTVGSTLAAEQYQFTVASGLATGTLAAAVNVPVGARPYRVQLGDVNGDGRPDLVTANHNNNAGNTVSVRLGDGAGGFGAGSADLSVDAGPYTLVLADVNNDGRLDIVVTCIGSGANTVNVLVRNASGSGAADFAAAQVLPAEANPRGLVLADLNNDGWLDLVTACFYSNLTRLQVRLNTQSATGGFGAVASRDFTGGNPLALAAGDVNNDGWLDILATSQLPSGAVTVALNDRSGALVGPGTTVAVGSYPMGLALADLNNDGNLDLAAVNQTGHNVSIRLGTGTGAFTTPTVPEIAVGGGSFYPENVALADLNGDGNADLVATSTGVSPGRVSVRLGTGTGTFTTPAVPEYNAGTQSAGLAVADVNGDGALDVATANVGGSTGANTVSVLLGVPQPVVSSISPSSGLPGTAVTISGSGFQAGSTATIGGVALAGVSVVTATTPQTLSGTVGANSPLGSQPVVVTTGSQPSNSNVTFTVLSPVPTLDSFTPASGAIGTTVTLTGTGLTGATAVAFNGTAAQSFTVVNSTTLTAVVAVGTTTGPLTVTTPGGTATSTGSFTVLQPSLSSFTPAVGPAGTVVTLTGTNLGGVMGVSFNGVAASSFTVLSGTTVAATVPAAAGTGRIVLSTPSGTLTSATDFEFIPMPTITYTPASAAVGQTITVIGTGLNYTTGIRFNEVPARFTVVSPTQLTVKVPLLASTGKLRLDSPGGSVLGGSSFTVRRLSSSLTFTQVTSNSPLIVPDFGSNSAAAVADIDGDGRLDVLVAAHGQSATTTGSLAHYEQTADNSLAFALVNSSPLVASITLAAGGSGNPCPTFADLDGDGLLDLVIGLGTGYLLHYEQSAVDSYTFAPVTNSGLISTNFGNGNRVAPTFTDLDGDGLLDLVTGLLSGLKHHEQSAVNSSLFTDLTGTVAGLVAAVPGVLVTPQFKDVDGDGLLDLLVGSSATTLKHYKQDAVNSVSFTAVAASTLNVAIGTGGAVTATPLLTDLDGDGLLDLLAGRANGTLVQYRQIPGILTVSTTGQTVLSGTYSSVTVTGTGEATLEGPVQVTSGFTVADGGVLNTACAPITGAGSFMLAAGGTLAVCDPAGISSSGPTGAVQVTGTRSFSADALYVYNGTAAQAAGSGLPATARRLTLSNTAALAASRLLTLPQNLTVTQALTLGSGSLITGSSKVVLAPTATISETSSSYVTGAVQTTRDLNTAGVAQSFGGLGLTLTPSGATLPGSTVVTRVTGTAIGSVSGSASVKRYFDIQPTINAGLSVALTLSYLDDELNGLAKTGLALYKSENGTAGPWVRQPSATLDAGTNTASLGGVSSFSTWTLGSNAGPLPVVLTTFTATAEGPAARLRWATASELHSARFEVERSADGTSFAQIGEVAAQGSKATATSYTFLDGHAPAGLAYYRLRQVDLDGTATYSPVRAVVLAGGSSSLVLYPNPARSSVVVSGLAAGAAVQVLDALGRLVLPAQATAAGQATLALPAGLAPGVYLVRSGGQVARLLVE